MVSFYPGEFLNPSQLQRRSAQALHQVEEPGFKQIWSICVFERNWRHVNHLKVYCTKHVVYKFVLSLAVCPLLFWVFLYILFIYLFLAALDLRCCARNFSSCGKQGLLFRCGVQASHCVASLVAELGL